MSDNTEKPATLFAHAKVVDIEGNPVISSYSKSKHYYSIVCAVPGRYSEKPTSKPKLEITKTEE